MRRLKIYRIISIILLCLLLLSCGTGREMVQEIRLQKNLQVWKSPDLPKTEVKRIAILPFVSSKVVKKGQTSKIVCSFCGHPIEEHKDFTRAGERLAEYLYEEMQKATPYEILPLEVVFSRLSLQEETQDPYVDIPFLMAFGKKIGVDAVVVGNILRIREREGGDYSVNTPASVAFQIKMIDIQSGEELYKALFDETQKPISEEPERLFRWSKLRFRWQTADQLSRGGMREVALSLVIPRASGK